MSSDNKFDAILGALQNLNVKIDRQERDIEALKEALQREKTNGDIIEDERLKKEREYRMLSELLERLQQNPGCLLAREEGVDARCGHRGTQAMVV